jgi:hypothetical protein
VFGILSGVTGIVFIYHRIRRKRRIRVTKNHNKRALLLFADTEKIIVTGKGLPGRKARLEDNEEFVKEKYSFIGPEEIMKYFETVKKARFGRDSITAQELREVELFNHRIYQWVYRELPFHKKIFLKLVLYMN